MQKEKYLLIVSSTTPANQKKIYKITADKNIVGVMSFIDIFDIFLHESDKEYFKYQMKMASTLFHYNVILLITDKMLSNDLQKKIKKILNEVNRDINFKFATI